MGETETLIRVRLSLDADGISRGYDEWIDVLPMDDPYDFIEECVEDYIRDHSSVIEGIAGKPFDEIEDTRAFVDVTYEYSPAPSEE